MGIPATSLNDFYHTRGERIFPSSAVTPWGLLRSFFRSKYSEEGLKRELQSVFQDSLLGDCRVPVVIPSYNLSENKVQIFKTRHHYRFEIDHKIAAWKVARATSAAPTYLPACREISQAQMIDGGVFANNPIMVGVTEALGVFGIPLGNIEILSIGTTKAVRRHSRRLDNAGVACGGQGLLDYSPTPNHRPPWARPCFWLGKSAFSISTQRWQMVSSNLTATNQIGTRASPPIALATTYRRSDADFTRLQRSSDATLFKTPSEDFNMQPDESIPLAVLEAASVSLDITDTQRKQIERNYNGVGAVLCESEILKTHSPYIQRKVILTGNSSKACARCGV